MDQSNSALISNPLNEQNGLFVVGFTVSNSAKLIHRKDGSGDLVVVEHEIALQPGVAKWSRFFDPKKTTLVRVDGETVVEYPKLRNFQQVKIKATKLRTDEHGQISITAGELLP